MLLMIRRGVRSFREIVETLSRYSIPKSSVYTAIEELANRGAIVKRGDALELTERGSELIASAVRTLAKRVGELMLSLTLLGEAVALDRESLANLDPDTLMELRDRLRQLIDVIDEALKRWRSVEIEWG